MASFFVFALAQTKPREMIPRLQKGRLSTLAHAAKNSSNCMRSIICLHPANDRGKRGFVRQGATAVQKV